eukprot:m.484205 g.484205  ORF g.484205 m.484205 type:complete len:69 (+) comp68071_c0_seq1:35-241(+)
MPAIDWNRYLIAFRTGESMGASTIHASEATRTEEDPILWAELQLTMAPTTLDSIRASSEGLTDLVRRF